MRTLYLTLVWVHLLAAMTWIGGMIVVATAVLPPIRTLHEPVRSSLLWHFFGAFRRVMWTALAVVAVTGGLLLWIRGVTLGDLMSAQWRSSPFGFFATLKIALLVVTVATLALHERASRPARAKWLGRLTFVVGAVMVLAAVLLVRGA